MQLTISVGDYRVVVDVQRCGKAHDLLDFVATCEGKTVAGRMTVSGGHGKTPEQLEREIREFAERIAHEAAEDAHLHKLTSSVLEPQQGESQ